MTDWFWTETAPTTLGYYRVKDPKDGLTTIAEVIAINPDKTDYPIKAKLNGHYYTIADDKYLWSSEPVDMEAGND